MAPLLNALNELDNELFDLLKEEDLNSEEVLLLIDKREQILLDIVPELESVPDFRNTQDWQEAILQTKKIVELMQLKTNQLGEQLHKYHYGNKSVQRYQQFL